MIKFKEIFGSGLVGAISANGSNQIVNLVVQLVTVPVFTAYWGLDTYGVWLILFTIPAYLNMADLGFSGAAANDMTADVARGDRASALSTYQAIRALMAAIGVLILAVSAVLIFGPADHMLEFAQAASDGQAQEVTFVLILFAVTSFSNGILMAGMRAAGLYAQSQYITSITTLLYTLMALATVMLGGTLLHVAIAYFVGRVIGLAAMSAFLHRRAGWLLSLRWQSNFGELRRLFRPAMALMTVPIAYLLSIQGLVLVVGAAAGPAAVPVFTVVRTLTRTAIQLTGVVNQATMPHFTVAAATDHTERKADLFALSLVASLFILVPAFFGLLLLGQWVVEIWTSGTVEPDWLLIAVMSCVMLVNGIWQPISNLIIALNQHGRFSYVFMLLTILMLPVAYLLTHELGPLGAAIGLLLLDVAMLGWVGYQAVVLEMVNRSALRDAPFRVWRLVEKRLPERFRASR
ncbi:lipopolysaccharide biosynthesis protein [Croceicoccus sp. YJ47]|uniref:lipopolysaccharide biosynthesis protein n=1 Tax=Croceicoccus sp. YJ47 TaxID=2798724 RepID=UPI001921F0E2|nr:lipopolysaccharide biosynthesis protein [Croceicoccus sp. YJ47]QQN72994.1 lipopolysaccharide biosynthesis protein [Croceicoccus sp. YJ47]